MAEAEFLIQEEVVASADGSLLQIVLDNLMGNAWKYTSTREKAVIEFGVEEREGRTIYFVRDNGVGINVNDREKLFLPFQRLSQKDEFHGHGIGLATVNRIIERHGGTIWAESEPGQGASFFFTLGE